MSPAALVQSELEEDLPDSNVLARVAHSWSRGEAGQGSLLSALVRPLGLCMSHPGVKSRTPGSALTSESSKPANLSPSRAQQGGVE